MDFKKECGITYIKTIPQGFICYLSFTGQQYSYYKLTKQEYRAFETILKKELNSSNNTLPYDHYFVQYFGYQKMHMKYVFANLYAYEVHNDQGIIKSKYRTLFNTADAAQGGRNFVQVHINITDKKVELLSINKGTELSYKQTTKK